MRLHPARTRTLVSTLSTTTLLACVMSGCGGSPPPVEDVGQALVAITKAPANTRCLVVTVAGARTVTRNYDLTPGQGTLLTLTGLPIGSDTFTANAFSETCNQIAMMKSEADWVSDPVSANVVAGIVANVLLVMRRNGQAQVAVDFQEDDGGVAGPILSHPTMPPLVFSRTLDVTIDAMDPAVPLEGRPVVVYFTAANRTASTVSGRALANVTPTTGAAFQSSAWGVTSLAAGASMRGVLLFDAPGAAAANGIEVFVEDANHTHLASRTDTFDTAARYTFSIPKVHIDNPRSSQTDTDYIAFAGEVDHSVVFNKSGFLGNGHAGTDFSASTEGNSIVPAAISEREPIDVVPDTGPTVTVAALTLNWGMGEPPTAQTLTSLGAGFLDGSITTSNIVDGPWWQTFFGFTSAFDCDGLVAAERRQWSARDLLDATPYAPIQGLPAYLGGSSETRYYPGYRSPPICGQASNYHMTWGITRWGVTFDNLVTVTPKTRLLSRNQSANFTATSDVPVIWSVDGGVSNGTIDQSGHYVAPSTLSADDFVTIRAIAGDGSARVGRAFVSYGTLTVALPTCPVGTACH